VPDGSNVESALIAKRAVWGALDALHPRRRAIVILSELEGMNPSAIGSLLGISAMTVRWHLSARALPLEPSSLDEADLPETYPSAL
jgi:DNA-directed RNA polymerase specialized sigma24 family protein